MRYQGKTNKPIKKKTTTLFLHWTKHSFSQGLEFSEICSVLRMQQSSNNNTRQFLTQVSL